MPNIGIRPCIASHHIALYFIIGRRNFWEVLIIWGGEDDMTMSVSFLPYYTLSLLTSLLHYTHVFSFLLLSPLLAKTLEKLALPAKAGVEWSGSKWVG